VAEIAPEIELAMNRKRGFRDSKDGEPFYCTTCGAGWNEYGACEEVDCALESKEAAMARHVPSVEIPPIVGYNVGDYSDIMEEPIS